MTNLVEERRDQFEKFIKAHQHLRFVNHKTGKEVLVKPDQPKRVKRLMNNSDWELVERED